jgi:hypothetical protein
MDEGQKHAAQDDDFSIGCQISSKRALLLLSVFAMNKSNGIHKKSRGEIAALRVLSCSNRRYCVV